MTDAELATLGLIADLGPCSGYALIKGATERGMARWAGLSASSVYGCVRKLERAGWVAAGAPTKNVGKGPAGRRYQIARDGKETLRTMALRAVEDSTVSGTRLKIALASAHHLGARHLFDALSVRLGTLEDRIATLRRLRREQGIKNAPLGAQLLFEETLASLKHEVRRSRAIQSRLA